MTSSRKTRTMVKISTPWCAAGVESDSESMPATTVMAQVVVRSIRSRQPAMRPISARWNWASALMVSVEVEGNGGWDGRHRQGGRHHHPARRRSPVAVISVGGFLGIGNRYVAVPLSDLHLGQNDRWTLARATKEYL